MVLSLLASTAWADPPGVHGMLLFGQQTTYASHLPMFHAPHDYQVILKLELVSHSNDEDAVDVYETAKAAGRTMFTLVPEVMDLTQVMSGQKTDFLAQVFDGHFERGGTHLGTIQALVERVVYARKLSPHDTSRQSQYLLFGDGDETYAAHVITGRPNFDAIASVDVLTLSALQLPVTIAGPFRLPNHAGHVQEPHPTPGLMLGDVSSGNTARVEQVLYLETGDLAH